MPKVKSFVVEKLGQKLIIPEAISYDEAIEAIKRQKQYEETETDIIFEFPNVHPNDALNLIIEVLKKKLGTMTQIPGSPTIEFSKGLNETVIIPVGGVQFIGLGDGVIDFKFVQNTDLEIMLLARVRIKQKYADMVKKIMDEVKREIACKENSLYKAKALYFVAEGEENEEEVHRRIYAAPHITFLDYGDTTEDQIVLNADIDIQVRTNIYAPIENKEMLNLANVSRKWGILLYGEYGVGKTILSKVVARKAVENGYTFIYVKNPKNILAAYKFAIDYAPTVLFIEDIDKILSGERTTSKDLVANILDGIDTKDINVILLATTNHVKSINPVFLRFGRFDQIIEISKPNAESVVRLLELYGGEYLDPNDDYTKVGELLAGQSPATIKNCIEKAKLYEIYFSGGVEKISAEALFNAARQMKHQISLLEEMSVKKVDKYKKAVLGYSNMLKTAMNTKELELAYFKNNHNDDDDYQKDNDFDGEDE